MITKIYYQNISHKREQISNFPLEITLPFQTLKVQYIVFYQFANVLYIVHSLVSISKQVKSPEICLFLCIRKSHSVNYDLFRFNQSTYLESFPKYQYHYTINLIYFPYVNSEIIATLIYVSSVIFSQT